jgi:hypothetical protein
MDERADSREICPYTWLKDAVRRQRQGAAGNKHPIRIMALAIYIALYSAIAYAVFYVLRMGSRDARMPPGPPTLPILGNLHQIPVTGLYKQ